MADAVNTERPRGTTRYAVWLDNEHIVGHTDAFNAADALGWARLMWPELRKRLTVKVEAR